MAGFDETDGVLPMGDSGHVPALPEPYQAVELPGGPAVIELATGRAIPMVFGWSARAYAARLNDGARILGRSLPAGLGEDDTDGDESAIEHSWLAGYDPLHASGPSAADETRERVARCNERHSPLRARMTAAAHRMTTGVEADGTVRLPREAAHYLAALMLYHAARIPAGTDTIEDAVDRGLLDA